MKLLVVDDDPAVRVALARLLGLSHSVTTATGYVDALEQLKNATFDAVLCDVVMPDGSGLKLLQEARSLRPELASRFVLMTGGSVNKADALALEAAGVEVIPKPFEMKRLEAALARISG